MNWSYKANDFNVKWNVNKISYNNALMLKIFKVPKYKKNIIDLVNKQSWIICKYMYLEYIFEVNLCFITCILNSKIYCILPMHFIAFQVFCLLNILKLHSSIFLRRVFLFSVQFFFLEVNLNVLLQLLLEQVC